MARVLVGTSSHILYMENSLYYTVISWYRAGTFKVEQIKVLYSSLCDMLSTGSHIQCIYIAGFHFVQELISPKCLPCMHMTFILVPMYTEVHDQMQLTNNVAIAMHKLLSSYSKD